MSFYDAHGRRIELADQGRRGGEGSVHRMIRDGSRVAKIYHAARLSPELHTKLRVMLDQPPHDPAGNGSQHRSIAWIDGLVYADSGRSDLRGFTMPLVDTDRFRQAHVYYDPSDRLRLFGGDFTWRHLLVASHNLASAVSAVHAASHCVGDLRETNLLVAPSALVTLIDCDSFQIRDRQTQHVYPTRVATGDYLPPELQGIDFRTQHPDRYHADLFALSVLVFRFLMLGVHPYQARGPAVGDAPTTEAKIRKGLFPFATKRRGLEPPEYAPPYNVVPPALQRLFARAFVDGHTDPTARPTAAEWVRALAAEKAHLKECAASANHVYGRGPRGCPWCKLTTDAFPGGSIVGRQIALQNAPSQLPESARVEQVRAYARVALADGAFTDHEVAYLRKAGGELGLRTAVIDRVIDDEARRTAPLPPSAKGTMPRFGIGRAWSTVHALRDRKGRSALKAGAVVMVAAALGGALAPVIAPVVTAVLVLPAVAAIREIQSARGWRARAMLPVHLVRLVQLSLAHAVRVYLLFAVVGAVAAVFPIVPLPIAIQSLGALATGTLVIVAATRLPGGTDRFAGPIRAGRDFVWRSLVGESGRTRRPAYALCALNVCAAAGLVTRDAIWWPLALMS